MGKPTDTAKEAKPLRLLAVLGKPALLAGGLIAAGWMLRNISADGFSHRLAQLDNVAFIGAGAAVCAIGMPRQLVAFAGGYGHGPWFGGVLALSAQTLGCVVDLVWARMVAGDQIRNWIRQRLGARFTPVDRLVTKRPFTVMLILRLLPIGSNLALNLLAGSFDIPVGPFVLASIIGYVPQTLVFVLLGSGVRIGHTVELSLAGGLLAVSTALGLYLLRRQSWHND